MKDFEEFKKKSLKNPRVREAYEAYGPGFHFAQMLISKRLEKGLSQKDLARRLGTTQSAVARMESGDYNPSLKTLYRVAHALEAEFEPSMR